ncbi:phosphatase PAP2 family protein [Saliphagus sp. LR7]|uniref:phosphatase PAP2 family protein n=1 Tax=Saliphagus sp. LR7 TaxID=2282654 RepID=UPI000DF754BB|nr:phosphatase PAP2 family protein [Saliphagus sp. LR7]
MNLAGHERGVGIAEALHGAAEWPVIVLFGLLTQLGDVWFLFLVGGSLYVAGDTLPWRGIDRRKGLFVLALGLTYVALVGALKAIFQLPRPPGAGTPPELVGLPSVLAAVVESITTADSPGFPSGHALGTTMVWGGLALVLPWGTRRKRAVVAAGVILLVSLSRLVLGVHYLADVVAGMALGVVVLGALYRLSDDGTAPGRALFVAAAVGAIGVVVTLTFDSVAASGGALGAWVVWRAVADTTPAHPTTRREVVAGFLVLGAGAALFGGLTATEPPLALTFLGAVVAGGLAVGAPLAGERLA